MGDGEGNARLEQLREQLANGEISREEMRGQMRQARAANGDAPGMAAGRPGRGADGGAGMMGMGRGGGQDMMDDLGDAFAGGGDRRRDDAPPRPAITFVVSADGTIEPRPILIGLNDWDNTEVVAGLEEGEEVALIGAAQLQAQQQEFVDRMRERMGGGSPFGGGAPRGGRR